VDFAQIIAIEFVILGFLILSYGFFDCNQSANYHITSLELKCFVNYALLASAIMFGGVAASSIAIREIEKSEKEEKKRNPKQEIEIAWPAKPKEKP